MWNGKDTKATQIFRRANLSPCNFAVTARASFLPSPKEGTAPFINGFNNPRREKPRTHGMGDHGRENRVDQKKRSANGKGATTPTGEAHITLGNNGAKSSFLSLWVERGSPRYV
jgi:hypothetical protein